MSTMIFPGLLMLAVFGEFTESRNVCSTPDGHSGVCIPIQSCPELFGVVKQVPVPSSDVRRLRELHCGFEGSKPKVCCQSRTSASGNHHGSIDHVNEKLLNHDICGSILAERIFGGRKTSVFDYPWMALLKYRKLNRNKLEYRCGGSIINKRYILTAAHCITGLPSNLKLIGVRVGEHDLRTERDCDEAEIAELEADCAEPYQDLGIESSIFHYEYSASHKRNDIGLLRVTRDIDFHPDNVRPICLPLGGSADFEQSNLIVTGWGITENGRASEELLQLSVPIVSNNECSRIYKDQASIWERQMCAGGVDGADSCTGDSGGPLQGQGTYRNSSRFIQYGIVSLGPRICGQAGIPGVYTKVSYYTGWILNNISD